VGNVRQGVLVSPSLPESLGVLRATSALSAVKDFLKNESELDSLKKNF